MKQKFRRVHTRKIDRGVARKVMETLGMRQFVKRGTFRKEWRNYAREV